MISFGITNAQITFFGEHLDKCMVALIDNTLIYTWSIKEHDEELQILYLTQKDQVIAWALSQVRSMDMEHFSGTDDPIAAHD